MAARFILVALVAGMGIQPPSRDEVSSLVERGRVWVAARIDDWSVTTARRAREANDRAFGKIVEEMSRDFTADLARMEAKKTEQSRLVAFDPILVPEDLEQIAVADEYGEDAVSRLIAEGTGSDDRAVVADFPEFDVVASMIREIAKAEVVARAEAEAEAAAEAEYVAAVEAAAKAEAEFIAARDEAEAEFAAIGEPAPTPKAEPAPARGERLSSAVNLTRQAFIAWASLLSSPGAVATR